MISWCVSVVSGPFGWLRTCLAFLDFWAAPRFFSQFWSNFLIFCLLRSCSGLFCFLLNVALYHAFYNIGLCLGFDVNHCSSDLGMANIFLHFSQRHFAFNEVRYLCMPEVVGGNLNLSVCKGSGKLFKKSSFGHIK
jgi:hypothetical protein